MSTYYFIYAEAWVKDHWVYLGPYTKDHEGNVKKEPIFWAQSRFYDLYVDLEQQSILQGIPKDASDDLKAHFRETLDEECSFWPKDMTWRDYYRQTVFAVDYQNAIKSKVKNNQPYKYQRYITKEQLASFECGELEDIEFWLTYEEYKDLPEEERKRYVYYEWNNLFDNYGILVEITNKIDALLDWTEEALSYGRSPYTYEEIGSMRSRVRVYIDRS